ncbi:hypothetical protein [Butyrivibrio sp. WCD2001]|uniref:hypothetical protein n=1 Tax=Butyrivibrio sp. WCD2001 TaxID=1280681 RepID=UPI0003FE652F|nr:hypothetical protein [Butyrivibrio sp. WCD2001]
MQNIKKVISQHFHEVIFFIIIFIYHIFIKEYSGDSLGSYAHFLDDHSLLWALNYRFMNWTSRVLIDLPIILIAHNQHIIIWKFLDIIMFCILQHGFLYLTDKRHPSLVTGLLLLYPLSNLSSAGWIATTINYLWPAALGSIALCLTKYAIHKKPIPLRIVIPGIICTILATNFETLALFFFIVLSYIFIKMLISKKYTTTSACIILVQLLVSAANILIAYLCPGNTARKAVEIRWMHDFLTLTLIDKISLGITSTLSYAVQYSILCVFMFCILFIGVCRSNIPNKKHMLILSAIAPTIFFSKTIFAAVSNLFIPAINSLFDYAGKITNTNYRFASSYLTFVLSTIIIAGTLITIMVIFNDYSRALLLSIIFIGGLSTRLILGFSPSLYASGYRTFFFFELVCLYLITCTYDEIIASTLKLYKNINMILSIAFRVACVLAIISNFMTVCSHL